jgi:hypothetical protein
MEGCRRINVLIGPPNVGKSNILEAMSCFARLHKTFGPDWHASALFRIDKLRHLFHQYNIKLPFEINIDNLSLIGKFVERVGFDNRLDNTESPKESILITCIQKDSVNPVDYDFHYSINQDLQISDLTHNPERFSVEPDKGGSFAKQFAKYKYEGSKIGSQSSKKYLSLNSPFGENLYTYLQFDEKLKTELEELVLDFGLEVAFDDLEEVVKFYHKESRTIIPFLLVADTLKRLFFHKAAISSNNNSILLFEEPEAHCYPPYISKFIKDVIFDENQNQFFIATHSPYILNDLMENARQDLAVFFTNHDKGNTTVRVFNDDELHEAYQYGYDFFMNMEHFEKPREVYG